MREIKFRGKCVDTGKWVYGYYIKHLPYTPSPMCSPDMLEEMKRKDEEATQHKIAQDQFSDWNMPRGINVMDVKPETVGQYTGLTDKNGVEIYEGDIISVTDELNTNFRCRVTFMGGAFFGMLMDSDDVAFNIQWTAKNGVVIGNIHEGVKE